VWKGVTTCHVNYNYNMYNATKPMIIDTSFLFEKLEVSTNPVREKS